MGEQLEAGFAKLQGEGFEYYMQTYSIILGRNSKKTFVDVDLASLGGGMNISRQHAKIFYDFERKAFVLEVIGKNGCYVEGVHMLPGDGPVKLSSQDLLQIGDKKFYFLLPAKKMSRAGPSGSASASGNTRKRPASSGRASKSTLEDGAQPPKKRNQPKGEGGSARVRKEPVSVAQAGETNLTAGSSSVQGPSSHSG
eukprot:TRINITY_DN1814_c0_g2_i1.p1 TRINITY_DN1814_c0_g2~~TRINITY_DN1814_c0_g2_i1.p1  ORF type:complete len:197 (-),score=42.69 TRINITY_DN1814_c0_g2_i1:294-884(-)